MRYYCSYFDRNYLARALVLLESLERHEKRDFCLIVVCLDEVTRVLLNKLQNKRLVVLSRHELEYNDQALVGPRQERSFTEYYWTLSPTAILYALDLVPEGEPLIYLDADLCFFSDPEPMLSELDGHSVLIHEHRFAPEFAQSEIFNGRFNVGLMGFRNDRQGREVLNWWRERCNEWCYARTEDGKFGDQMYLNDWPTRFAGVRVLQHPGGGVAPWNQGGLKLSRGMNSGGSPQLLVEGQPLVFFHFHALVPIQPQAYLMVKHGSYPLPELAVRLAYFPYVMRQEYWNDWLRQHIPSLRFGYWPEQPLFDGAALLVGEQLAATLSNVKKQPLSDGWVLLPGKQVRAGQLPRISIITSVFNGDQFIRPFLEDISRQSIFMERCELILINANSPGNEEPTILEFVGRFPNNVVYRRLRKDPGIYACWNIAIGLARGEFISNANLDDRKALTALEELAKALLANVDADFVYADNLETHLPNETWENNSSQKFYASEEFSIQAMLRGNPPHCMPMWRKSLHDRFGLFDEKYRSASDWEFWLRCTAGGSIGRKVGIPLGLYYLNPTGMSTNLENDSWKKVEEKEIFDKYAKILGKSNSLPILVGSNIELTIVSLDISVLGVGHLHERARTGIYRVVDNFLKELKRRPNIKLSLVTHASVIDATKEFVKTRPDLVGMTEVRDLSSVPADQLLHSPFFPLPASSYSGPRVLTVYDLIPIKFPQLFEFGEDKSFRNTIASLCADDFVTVISESTKVDLCEFAPHLRSDRIMVTPLAADSRVFYPSYDALEKSRVLHQYHLDDSFPYLLSVATLEPRKNIAHLIRSYVRLLNEDKIPDLKLVLVGAKGWKFDAIFDELSLAGEVRDRIIVTGFVPDEDMAALYSNAMAFAYPSLYEGFGLPPLEAMQCGTPVITSDNSSLPEVVGDAGILVPAQDEAALVDAIRRLYYDAALRQQLSQKGLARAATFTWERCVDQTVATYRMAYAHWASKQAAAASRPKTIVVDAVFFQLYQTGIARVWRSLLQEWALTDFGKRLVVLDRAGSAPRFEGIKYIAVPQYDYADTDSDRAMLQRVCDAENATVFISSYYTTPVKTPSVFMAHDMIPELVGVDVVNTPMWREKHFGVRHAQRFIAVSNNTAKDLRQFFPNITPDQITVAHNGVNFKQQGADAVAVFRGAYGVDRPYFLLVGARDGYKNTTLFFKAFAALGASRARYSIVCTGPALELEPQHAVAIRGAKVHMLNLSDTELQCAYSGALALIYPSLYEGFGMPILEAMACGCPVITTRKGSIPEVAGDAALYVDGADVGEMTRALKHVQKAPVRKRFVELGLKRAAGFSWKKMADQVQQVLAKAFEEITASKADQPMDVTQTIQIRREQALGTALQYHQAGQLDQADSIYLELLGVNADDFVALHLHGVVLHQRGYFAQAEDFLLRALTINNVTPAVHHNLGNVYMSQGRTDQARSCFTKAITLDPNFELALAQLAALDKAQL